MPKVPSHIATYRRILANFLAYRDGIPYPSDAIIDNSILSAITVDDICLWFYFKAYGTPTPNDEARPQFARHSTLHFYKKAISYFIPNKHLGYNVETLTGNPTKAPVVNQLIKDVKRHEVRAEGAPSQARRDISIEEFRIIISILEQYESFQTKVHLPCIFKLQFHLIARIDDTCHIATEEIRAHTLFDFALRIRLRWTKNCLEERDAPEQIVLGSMDKDVCVLVALGIFLSYSYEFTNAFNSEFLFCDSEEEPGTVNAQAGWVLHNKVISHDDWKQHQKQQHDIAGATKGFIGTHSFRKLATTLARLMGCSQDEVENRGRWRNTKRISDRYTAISLPIVDATVAGVLCIGGPCKYNIIENVAVTDDWLVGDFVPKIASKFGNRVGAILGRSLLWALNDAECRNMIPDNLYNRLHARYNSIKIDDKINPIEKKLVVIYPVNGQLLIDEASKIQTTTTDGDTTITRAAVEGNNHASTQALLAQNNALRIQVSDLTTVVRQQHDYVKNELSRMKGTIRRFANRPAQVVNGFFAPRGRQQQNDDNSNNSTHIIVDDNNIPFASTLCSKPRDLYQLWEEYEFGIGGRKPASKFSTRERGRVKYKYHRRKVVWDKIKEMIRRGHSNHTAIDELYRTYGERTTVTEIINNMRRDKQNEAPV